MTTRQEIARWFDDGLQQGARFMSVYCDDFDYGDYPVYTRDIAEFWARHDDPLLSKNNMQRLIEVYDLSMDKETQLAEVRARHLPDREEEP